MAARRPPLPTGRPTTASQSCLLLLRERPTLPPRPMTSTLRLPRQPRAVAARRRPRLYKRRGLRRMRGHTHRTPRLWRHRSYSAVHAVRLAPCKSGSFRRGPGTCRRVPRSGGERALFQKSPKSIVLCHCRGWSAPVGVRRVSSVSLGCLVGHPAAQRRPPLLLPPPSCPPMTRRCRRLPARA